MRIDRVLANNPGPFTGPGTNTWLLDDGHGELVVIDPGPVDRQHAERVLELAGDRRIGSVLVTHTHIDHAPLANPLAAELGVAAVGHASGPEFVPDIRLTDADSWEVGRIALDVVHTPGHADDHLCFRVGNVLFTGDHIMGGSSVMVEKLGPYLRSLERLRGTGLDRLYPGHGDEMSDPDDVIDWYLAHRRQRHSEILEAIRGGAVATRDIVEVVYRDVDSSLHPLAARSVNAHLDLLVEEGQITWDGATIEVTPP